MQSISTKIMSVDYITLQNVTGQVNNDYHKQLVRKLINPKISSKTYWSILKTFYNGKKVPLKLPLVTDNKLEPNFKRKTSLQ